jgi:hypothetical protein
MFYADHSPLSVACATSWLMTPSAASELPSPPVCEFFHLTNTLFVKKVDLPIVSR